MFAATVFAAPPNAEPAAKDGEKRIAFEKRNQPWPDVLEWLAEETGLEVRTNQKPNGTVTFIAPKNRPKKYSIPQIIDILNEQLADQKMVLVRRTNSFTILSTATPIDSALLPRIDVGDLPNHGDTELVTLLLPLNALVAEEVVPEVKTMLGPSGTVTPLARSNQLILQGSVAHLKRVVQNLKESEDDERKGESFTHVCRFIHPREAEKILKEQLEVQPPPPPPMPGQPQMMQQQPGGPGGANAPKTRKPRVSSDERTKTVIVSGTPDKLALARQVLKAIDVPGDPTTRTELIPLNTLDAAKIVPWLQQMHGEAKAAASDGGGGGFRGNPFGMQFGMGGGGGSGSSDAKIGVPFIEADASRNAIIVKGSPEQIAAVKTSIKALGEDIANDKQGGNMRTITLEKGSASTLAEALERLLTRMRKNPVNVVIPGGENRRREVPRDKPDDDEDLGPRNAQGQLVDPRGRRLSLNDRPGRRDVPINLTAFGNKLIVTCDEPDALSLVQELSRLLTQTNAGEGDFEVIRLRHTGAEDAAKVIDEAFNGNKNDRNNNNSRFFWYDPYESRQNKKPDRIRVVADKPTNSLLVRANPLDMLTIRRLVERTIDNADNQSTAQIKTWVIGPLKAARAKDVEWLVKDVYKEHLNNTLAAYQSGALRQTYGGWNGINLNLDASGNPRSVDLTVSTDEQTNTLVVSCTEQLYADIRKLVDKLDDAAKNSKRTVKVISVKGIDPVLVQKAIDAIQGKARNGAGMGTGTGNTGGKKNNDANDNSSSLTPDWSRPEQVAFLGGGGGRDGPPGRGPDFFVDGVKDDPRPPLLFDPQQQPASQLTAPLDDSPPKVFQLVNFEEQQPPPAPPAPPGADQAITGPRSPVTAEALEQLGVIVISGNNPADVDEVIRMIEFIQKLGATAEIQLQMVFLEYADATSVAATLTEVFRRVIVNASGNTRAPLTPQGQPQQPQQQPQPGQPAPEAQAGRGQQPGQNVQQTQQQQFASVTLIGLPRLNAILLAAPKARVEDVVKEIKRLDRPTAPNGKAVPFPLRKASAAKVEVLINNFYATRFPNETAAQHQIRVTHDDSSNTVFVQAAPADMAEIRSLIERIDTTVSSAVNDVRIVRLNNAVADDMAGLLTAAIAQGVVGMPAATAFGGLTGAGGLQGARPPGAPTPGVPTPTPTPGTQPATGAAAPGQAGAAGKMTTLRFISPRRDGPGIVESGFLEDIHITPDIRTNSLILAAPTKTIELLLAMIRELDALPAARAEVNIFTLKKADATFTRNMLLQLFYGGASSGGLPTGGVPGGAPGGGFGGPGAQALGVTQPGGAGGPFGAGGNRPIFTLGGTAPDGTPLVDLRISVDERTNSLIIAASRNDLDIITALINRLEDSDTQIRRNQVYRLKNIPAVDAAAALRDFLERSLRVLQQSGQLTTYQEVQREVIVVPEPINNSLLISATPRYFDDLMNLIVQLDATPPQVMIQVLVAEVDLSNTKEFGVELGLQSPVLFQRSIYGTGGYTFPADGLAGILPAGVTINNAVTPANVPGYNFNNAQPLGNSPLAANPGIVGLQGISNLGVGRVSPTSNVGGFVFSANSDAVNVLVRALQTQGRIDILSRPQITTMDNQTAQINIGQNVPLNSGSFVSVGTVSNNVVRVNVGVVLNVTPRISPDGTVLMRVHPAISSVSPQTVPLGGGQVGTILNVQEIDTTVLARDGETVALGGLISKRDTLNENKVPWFGDLPYLGTLFRYRTQDHTKTELLVIMTPHIIRCPADADQLLGVESQRIQWNLDDVMKVHATTGMEPILANSPPGGPVVSPAPPGPVPGKPEPVMGPLSKGSEQPASGTPAATTGKPVVNTPSNVPMPAPMPSADPNATPAAAGKENRGWRLFRN